MDHGSQNERQLLDRGEDGGSRFCKPLGEVCTPMALVVGCLCMSSEAIVCARRIGRERITEPRPKKMNRGHDVQRRRQRKVRSSRGTSHPRRQKVADGQGEGGAGGRWTGRGRAGR